MTLVLTVIHDEEIHLVADTLIGFDARLGRKPYHALKILSLSPTRVLAFSGSHERAMQIFFELFAVRAHELEISRLVQLLEQLRMQNSFDPSLLGEPPDFLIACTIPNTCVYRVNEHGISECPSYGWIGNSQAAASAAKHIADNEQLEIASIFRKMVFDNVYGDVGGHVVHVRGDRNGFKFVPCMRLASPRYIPVEGWNTVDFGNAESGGYGFTSITPYDSGHNGYGVFFFQGQFGFFFHVDPLRKICETLKVYAATSSEFMRILEGEVGFILEHCGSLG